MYIAGELRVGRLELDDRRLRLGRKVVAHLRDLRLIWVRAALVS